MLGYGSSYGENVPGFKVYSAYELVTSGSSRADGEVKAGVSEDTPKEIGNQKDTRIAQGFAGENGVQWDPVSELFKVIVGGAIVGVKSTLDAASDLYQQVMKSRNDGDKQEQAPEEGDKQRHGGGKNAQHGKAEDRPSDLRRLEELDKQIKEASGSEKKKLKAKKANLREEMAKRRKGENHSRKNKK
jgi:hypothetical protein